MFENLSAECREFVKSHSDGSLIDVDYNLLQDEFERIISDRNLLEQNVFDEVKSSPEFTSVADSFPQGLNGILKSWSLLEVRLANYVALSQIFKNQFPSLKHQSGPLTVYGYLSRGEILGEMGVLSDNVRNATCIVYDPAADDGLRPGRVELVTIPGEDFKSTISESIELSRSLEQLIADRQVEIDKPILESIGASWDASPDFQQQGLAQGQQLLLIDLESCTRCGDCVDACVESHDDGYSRLFLDGPRFDRFLVPSACRQCHNPSCMIGCPVGSIQRGTNGQIEITDWCIGCGMCERQCPFDSIQMHDVGFITEHELTWEVNSAALASGDWQTSIGNWMQFPSPFTWNIDFQTALSEIASNLWERGSPDITDDICFRIAFDLKDFATDSSAGSRLQLESPNMTPEVWVNGTPIELSQDSRQRKRGEFTADINTAEFLSNRRLNILAVKLQRRDSETNPDYGSTILNLRLDRMPAVGELTQAVMEDNVIPIVEIPTDKAVVCDLCSDTSTGKPMCVSSCPHEAAMRVEALEYFAFNSNANDDQ